MPAENEQSSKPEPQTNGALAGAAPVASINGSAQVPSPNGASQQPPAPEPPPPPIEDAVKADVALRAGYEADFLNTLMELTRASTDSKDKVVDAAALSRLVIVGRKLSESDSASGMYRQAYFAARILRNAPSHSKTVIEIIEDIEFSTSRNSPIYSVMNGLLASIVLTAFIGMLLLLLSTLPYTYLGGSFDIEIVTQQVYEKLTRPFVICMIFGIAGSTVSILLRLSEFEQATRKSRQFLRMTGLLLPLVGGLFAAVTFALFSSGIINFQFANPSSNLSVIDNTSFYIVVGFLSGFSERFTRGLLGQAENAVSGNKLSGSNDKAAGAGQAPGTAGGQTNR